MRLASRLSFVFGAVLFLATAAPPAFANNTPQTLPFSQNWSNAALITANDNWSGVPGIEGFLGQDITTGTGTDPQTLLGVSALANDLDVIANQNNPNITNGGVAEFDGIANPSIALQGSGTADAPHVIFYLNTTGATGVTVRYTLRDLDATADNAVSPVALQFRVGAAGNFTNVPAGFVADATTGPSLATQTTPVCVVLPPAADNQAQVQVRVISSNSVGNDEWVGVDDIQIDTSGCGGPPPMPTLNINDVALAEGNPPGTTTFTFTVSLTAPAGPGGVTFDIATADGTAQDDNPATEDNDYVASSLTGQTIPAGSSTYAFNVTVNRDTASEANETFFVNVTSVTGALVGDGQGQGTINNDDVTITPIHDIQGPGASSPIVGATVTTRGIVTGVRSNGFFIQEPDATVDADPATSEGILVFTNAAPPAAAVVGALVQVMGTVAEFVPTQDPLQPPLTELTSPTVTQLSTGNPLPAPIPLTATFPDPAGPHDQLERLEGMRVSVASLTVVAPTMGNVNETNATATSSGVFFGVVTGVPRPFREPGIQAPDPAPSGGSIPPIPRFDSNPERIRVDSDGLVGGPLIDVGTGALVTGLVGPLDYTFRTYTVLPDPGATIGVAGGPVALMASAATAQEFTVASYNMERFFDTVNDPAIGEPVLTSAAFDMRLNKASLAIRNFLKAPDILGVVEVENLTTLQALAARISSDAIAASQPDPQYDAYLVEGNDIGGIDVGFLVKTAPVSGSTPRVEVVEVQQELDGTLFVNPDSSTETLNDRPPLRLNAVIHHMNGASFPVTVIVNHLRSLIGVNVEGAGSNGWPSSGARIRAKRLEQAEDLANLVQARQTANPNEHIVLVGDFNAFEFSDGLVDSMNVIAGTPPPDNQTAVPGDGVDLVNPDLDNLDDTLPPSERYSYTFDGSAQTLDHVLVNQALIADTTARRLEHPRINADFPQTARNDGSTPVRLSDHDPVIAYFQVEGFASSGLSITKVESADPVTAGTDFSYTITVNNTGPDAAADVEWSDTLPAGTTFVSLSAVAGWTCVTPAVGSDGIVSCSIPSLGTGSVAFTLTVHVSSAVQAGSMLSNTANVSTTTADDPADNSATETTTVAASAGLSVTKVDNPDPVAAGANLTYTITVNNAGPSNASTVSLSDTLPAGTSFQSLSGPAGWSCTTPAVGAGGTVTCSIASFLPGSAVFTLTVQVNPLVADGTVLSNTANVSDSVPGDESATATTTVTGDPAVVSITKSDFPDPVVAGTGLTYFIAVTNSSGANLASATLTDPLPAGTVFDSTGPLPAGWSCTTPPVGANGTITCTAAPFAPGTASFTINVTPNASLPAGTVLTNTATLTVLDLGVTATRTATTTTAVITPPAISATKSVSGSFAPGGTVTYTVVLTNLGPGTQGNNPGPEFSDVLPAGLTLVSATATSGMATATLATNTVTWDGSLAGGGGSVTITINATINAAIPPGTTISNQGTYFYDTDGDGTNESSGVTDNPSTVGPDSTSFVVAPGAAAGPANIPTLDEVGLALLVLLLAMGGAVTLRRRRA